METETCFTCDCEQGRHDIGAGIAIETCNPLRLCDASAASPGVGAGARNESWAGLGWATHHSDKIWTKSMNYTKFPGIEWIINIFP